MKFTKLAAAITLALAVSAAQAVTVGTSTFKVKIQITGTCLAGSFGAATVVEDIDFGPYVAATSNAGLTKSNTAANSLQVRCSKNLPVEIAMAPQNVASTTGKGVMEPLGASADTVSYQLRQPSALFAPGTAASSVWGSVLGTNTFSFVGAGLAAGEVISIPVTATIDSLTALNVEADSYEDDVIATLTY